jgi:hypothetical protein
MNTKSRSFLMLSFLAVTPLVTLLLLWMKGLPTFAVEHVGEVLIWVYGVTWVPALLAGTLLAVIVSTVSKETDYFHRPYDFGRCFSLGAIVGALTEALATWGYRALTHHPFSDFWIAGAIISGCLSGACLTAFFLRTPPLALKK